MRTVIAAGAVLALAACSGGSLSGTPATVGGIFSGTLSEGANSFGVSGIVDENGNSRFLEFSGSPSANDLSYIAVIAPGSDIPVDGGSSLSIPFTEFSINGEALDNGASSETGTLNVDYELRDSIQGTITDAHGSSGTLSLTFEQAYNDVPSSLAGTYTFTYSSGANSYLATIIISAGGGITGSDGNSCVYSGSYTVPNASYNAYDLSLTIANCADAGTLTGLAAYFPATNSQPNSIDAILSNSTSGAYLVLQQISS